MYEEKNIMGLAVGEREGGKGGSRLGRDPGRGQGARGFWAKKAERGKEKGEIPASFYFFYTKFPNETLSRKKKNK
jgi:hypothetical protein